MTDIEHMVAWIESSQSHYNRLVALEIMRKNPGWYGPYYSGYVAFEAFGIVKSAYTEAVHGGDMFSDQWSPAQLLDAAKALLEWELEA